MSALRAESPLLCKVMEHGKAIRPLPSLDEIRGRFKEDFDHLDDRFKALQGLPSPARAGGYEVALSSHVKELYRRLTVEAQR